MIVLLKFVIMNLVEFLPFYIDIFVLQNLLIDKKTLVFKLRVFDDIELFVELVYLFLTFNISY